MRGHILWSILSSKGISTVLLKAEMCLLFACGTSRAKMFTTGKGIVYGLPQDTRRLSLRTVTRKPAGKCLITSAHEHPSRWTLPWPVTISQTSLRIFCEFQAKSIRCETDVEMLWMGTLWWGGKRELEKHLENAEYKDWQQKTRAGNATMREFVPILVS